MTRRQLYERVWSTPLKRLAPELGLSDVGLAKICRRNNIPVPPRGYWAQVEFAKPVQAAGLPNPTFNPPVTWHESPQSTGRISRWEALLARVRELPPVIIGVTTHQHGLVLETERQLSKGFERAAAPKGILRVEVSTSAQRRALT